MLTSPGIGGHPSPDASRLRPPSGGREAPGRAGARARGFIYSAAVRSAGGGIASTAAAVFVLGGALAVFLDKAFHIDDPLFLWTARQITAAPGDFFGFELNWL